ncbi:hypothetical protein B0H17DRAFT_844044, partial [Mycena rosella]
GELEHRRVKRFYARTNKNTAVRQMTVLERREQALFRIARKVGKMDAKAAAATPTATESGIVPPKKSKKGIKHPDTLKKKKRLYVDFAEAESLPYTAPEQHHHISHSRNFPCSIPQFLSKNQGDPAVKV